MSAAEPTAIDTRVLVHAPRGRDADVVLQVLHAHGMHAAACATLEAFTTHLADGAGAALITEEALGGPALEALAAWLQEQPPWSDFPFMVLATRRVGRRAAPASDNLNRLGNVILLERPLHADTLVSAARSALRARTRQYETRRHLDAQEAARRAERAANAQARRASDALELALDGAELGTFHCPLPFNELFLSDTCKAHFWLEPHDRIDIARFYSIVHEADRPATRAALRAAIEDGALYDVEYRTVSPSGASRWIRAKGRAYVGEAGEPSRFDGVTLDISLQKHLEADREVLLAAERVARTQAERASRMKDQFLATLSHELRTPLSAILGWTHLLASGSARVDVAAAVATIERNARAQARLIEELLDVSRITSGNLQLDIKPVAMASVVTAVLSSLQPAADAKSMELVFEHDPAIASLPGDGHRLQQVVWNLVSNAIKFTPAKGRVVVRLRSAEDGLVLSVADTGEGIPAEFLPHVFERFRQADASEARSHGGLGLGLAIARHIVELHGGTVTAESAGPGRGATFSLHLPHVRHPEVDAIETLRPSQESVDPAASLAADADLSGIRIVLVDDEADGREMIGQLLQNRGAHVEAAGSADEALTLLRRVRADLVISDIGMPRVDGYELMRRIRADESAAWRQIPAIALTAFARAEDVARARQSGYGWHLAKPVEPARLFATVTALMAERNASES